VNGSAPSCRNWRRRKLNCSRNGPGGKCRTAVASLPVMGWLPTAIFTREALLAYPPLTVRLAKIYVPFVTSTGAGNDEGNVSHMHVSCLTPGMTGSF
jgi:hypothetical protein